MTSAPSVLNIHSPTESFAIVHSLTQDSLETLYDKLSRKTHTAHHGQRVGPGWLKYEFNDSVWNLDDDSDYTIFVWRQQQQATAEHEPSTSSTTLNSGPPTLYLHNPSETLPVPPAYQNAAFYLFHLSRVSLQIPKSPSLRPRSIKSHKTKGSRRTNHSLLSNDDGSVPKFKKDFEKFHSENGVRTVTGNFGNVKGVRMLLKSGYRHVYIRRDFAIEHGFISPSAAPGHGGYTGLVNIGSWPITLTSTSPSSHPNAKPHSSHHGSVKRKKGGPTWDEELHGPNPIFMTVYLSEEPHFDVVLGRSFFERRQIHIDPVNPTDVVCLDTGEKVDCDVIILKDGRGEIVTVT